MARKVFGEEQICAPVDPAIIVGGVVITGGVVTCIHYCAAAGRAIGSAVAKGWNTFWGKTTGKNPGKSSLAKQLDTGQDEGWEKVDEQTEPATSPSYPGGTSSTTRYRNRETGQELEVHELYDNRGNSRGHRSIKEAD